MDQKQSVDVAREPDVAIEKEFCPSAYRTLQPRRKIDGAARTRAQGHPVPQLSRLRGNGPGILRHLSFFGLSQELQSHGHEVQAVRGTSPRPGRPRGFVH